MIAGLARTTREMQMKEALFEAEKAALMADIVNGKSLVAKLKMDTQSLLAVTAIHADSQAVQLADWKLKAVALCERNVWLQQQL